MILSVRVNNFMFYSDEIELGMTPEISINRFEDNICHEGDFKALKSACLYGPNNSGKTCLVRAIKYIQSVLLNDVVGLKFYGSAQSLGKLAQNRYEAVPDILS